MKLSELVPRIRFLSHFESPPEILVIHCGGNDLGYVKLQVLRRRIKRCIFELNQMLPNTVLMWSQLLPRLRWRSTQNCKAMNFAALRINSFAAARVCSIGGGYIRYPEIKWGESGMFANDVVHLSRLENDMFIHNLQTELYKYFS